MARINVNEIVTLDFETYYDSDYTLANMAMSEYVLDSRFAIHCVGIKIGVQPTKVYYGVENISSALAAIDWARADVLAHNCAFDAFILTQLFGFTPRRYFDTLSMARGLGGIARSNKLGDLAERHGLGIKNTAALVNTKGKVSLTDAELSDLMTYCGNDVDLCFLLFVRLAQKMPAAEMDLIDLTIRMFAEPMLKVDIAKAEEQKQAEYGGKIAALFKAGVTAQQLLSDDQFAALLKRHAVLPPTKRSLATGKTRYAFAKTDTGMKLLMVHPLEEVRNLVDARLRVKSTIGETRAARLIEAGQDNRSLPVLLLYCGAHTTRWSAGNKMNMQNLPRGGELRKSVIAPPGHVLVIGDSAQIEARLNAWFCDETKLLQAFKDWDADTGPDVYKLMAAALFGIPAEAVSKEQRQVGKVVVLALGYGMGADKLIFTAANGKPPVKLDSTFAVNAVDTYRNKTCRSIASKWKELWSVIAAMYTGVPGDYKCIKWSEQAVHLPNGLSLLYPNLTLDFNGSQNASYSTRTGTTSIYGGLILENIIQALARCVVAEQMLTVSRSYRVVMMSHDEIVCCVPAEQQQACENLMHQVLKTPPSWAPDLPLNCEVQSDTCYSK